MFAGHPSLRYGDVVHFMELWGKSSGNTIIFTGIAPISLSSITLTFSFLALITMVTSVIILVPSIGLFSSSPTLFHIVSLVTQVYQCLPAGRCQEALYRTVRVRQKILAPSFSLHLKNPSENTCVNKIHYGRQHENIEMDPKDMSVSQ